MAPAYFVLVSFFVCAGKIRLHFTAHQLVDLDKEECEDLLQCSPATSRAGGKDQGGGCKLELGRLATPRELVLLFSYGLHLCFVVCLLARLEA